jgi:glycosyltransferase involved in cell wall biosynthesis
VERFAYRHVSGVICNAEHEAGYLERTLGATPAPISVVHNGFDLEACQKTRAQWRKELGLSEDALLVAMVANFRPEKDHLTLLCAWREVMATAMEGEIPRYLVFAGAHQESYSAVLEQAKKLDLLGTVILLGQVDDVSGLLAASDIGVLASRYEGLSNVIVEYMASGLPVVATDIPGNREALGHDPRQWGCPVGDSQVLATRLRALLCDPELRRQLGERNRKRAAEAFSIEGMCEGMVGAMTALLE